MYRMAGIAHHHHLLEYNRTKKAGIQIMIIRIHCHIYMYAHDVDVILMHYECRVLDDNRD